MIPDYTKIEEFVKAKLKPSRFIHSIGVMEMSVLLASRFGVDEEKAKVAGIYHDAYRYDSTPGSIELVEKNGYRVWPEERKENKRDRGTISAMCQNNGSLRDIAGVQDRLGYSSNYNTKPR